MSEAINIALGAREINTHLDNHIRENTFQLPSISVCSNEGCRQINLKLIELAWCIYVLKFGFNWKCGFMWEKY